MKNRTHSLRPSFLYSLRPALPPALPLGALAFTLAAAFAGTSAFAQTLATSEPVKQLKEVVVTASRIEARSDDLVSDVVVLDRAAIQASTGRTLTEVLARSAGIQLTATGGVGSLSGVFVRGTETRHTILLIDGVRYGTATAGLPNFDTLPLDMVERIEVLKGPGSALYGSDAVGGVVQVFLRKGVKAFSPTATVTLGSYGLTQVSASLAGSGGEGNALTYALGMQKTKNTGFSATNSKVAFGSYNADNDAFEQDALNLSVAYQINPLWRLDAGALYADGVSHYDDGPGNSASTSVRAQTLRAGLEGKVLPTWKTQLRASQSVDQQVGLEGAYLPSKFNTQQNQWLWQNDIDTPVGIVLAGVEQLVQKIDSSTAYDVSQRTVNSVFAGLNGNAGSHSWQVNMRQDSNSQFGDNSTWFAGYGFKINPTWRVNASYGTSFVAPSFNQLYYPGYSNPFLQPEQGKNLDLGVTYSENGQTVKLVRFDNKIRGFISNTTLPSNIPRARIEGWTLSYDGVFDALNLHASADVLDARNELTGKVLPRRASNQFSLGADYRVGAWSFGGNVLRVGSRFDDVKNTVALASYVTADVFVNYTINKDLQVQAKINNLANKVYETAAGYNQAGRAAYITLRYVLK
jgi:vitamin B12 transporter